ncbi:MAG: hypothetical protein ACYTF1_14620 [Planctomycetota bacterium]
MMVDKQNLKGSTKWPIIGYRLLWIIMLLPALTGCQDYQWIFDDFRTAEQIAGDQNKDLFIFSKYWLSPESNRMHGEVLTDAKVFEQLKNTVNLLIEVDVTHGAAQYMSKYGINSAPAFVVARSDGTFKTCTGYVPKERFIEFLKKAKTPPPTTQ